jgi:predicted AAA+ superfamily ATPase
MAYGDLRSASKLHDYIASKMTGQERYYIFLDEIQEVPEWERVVNSLLLDPRADMYITGSNSRLLSSELATYIAGRYVEIPVKPLSFAEYRLFKKVCGGKNSSRKKIPLAEDFKAFIRTGGFPAVNTGRYRDYEEMYKIINDIYASALLRDVVMRQNIRNVEILERVVKYVFDNIGNIFSAKRVADYFKSNQRKTDVETVYNYLQALEDAFIIKRIPRYDLKGKEILKTNEKYFVGDHSLVYAAMGYRDRMIAGVLENIVLHELERRGYRVFTGKLDQKEIDFVAEQRNKRIYVQVAYTLGDSQDTVDREFGPLLEIKDQYPKYVVSMDSFWEDNISGIQHKSIPEFLLMERW